MVNRLSRVLKVNNPRSMVRARSASPSLANRAARQGQVQERRLSPVTVAAVNDIEYSDAALRDAVKAAKDGKAPIRLLMKEFDRYRTITVDYHGGLRYPALERIEGRPDYLTPILSARK